MHCGAESGSAQAGGAAGWELPWRCGLLKLVWLESGVAHTQTVARWELPYTGGSQSCVVRGVGREICFVTKHAPSPVSGGALVHPLPHFVPHPPPFSRF
jgi:hypothetical protein